MNRKGGSVWRQWALVLVLLLAFGLRVYRIDAQSLWYDETVSVYLAGKSVPELVAHTAGDIHPPGYYLLLHAWTRLAGASALAAAYLSLFFGILLVALAYWLASWIYGPRAGLFAALLLAISPYNLWYSQEVRMYTLGAVLGMGVLAAVILLLTKRSAASLHWSLLAAYAICGALGLWVLYYFAFLLLAINLMVAVWWLIGWRRGRVGWTWLGRWMLAQGVVLLLYSPWIPVAWRQATVPPVPPWRGFTALGDVLVEIWSALSLGQSVNPGRVWPVLVFAAVLVALGLIYREVSQPSRGSRRDRRGHATPLSPDTDAGDSTGVWVLVGYVLIPVLLIYLASFIMPLYHVRYAFTYSTPFYILLGAGLAWLWQRWRVAAWLGLAVLVAFSALSIHAYHTNNTYASDDHREAARFLVERWRPGDAILVNAGYAYTALITYWDGDPVGWRGRLVDHDGRGYGDAAGQGTVVLQTGTVDGDPTLGWGDPDSDFYAMSQAQTEEALGRLFAGFDRVFVYRIYDTVTDEGGLIRDWLAEHGTQFEDRLFSGEAQLRVQGFLTGRAHDASEDVQPDSGLADGSLWLEAGTLLSSVAEVGGSLAFRLDWSVRSPPAGDATLFAGLFDDSGRRWAQTDEQHLGSLLPVGEWEPGTMVSTPLRIDVPAGTPPGRYRLEVGWYRFVDGQPAWLPWESGERLYLGDVEVREPADWWELDAPVPEYSAGVTIGDGVKLLGFDAQSLEGQPGDVLEMDLMWLATEDAPQPGLAVLQLADDAGTLFTEVASSPVEGHVPFTGMSAGQSVRDLSTLALPGTLQPGVYNLLVGRRELGGQWLPVRRGSFPLGSTYPLATVRVQGREVDRTRPEAQHPADVRFGEDIALVGYDLDPEGWAQGSDLDGGRALNLTLHWKALGPMETRYKVFVHLVGEGGPSDIQAQVDVYPRLPTSGWIQGEYLSDPLVLSVPGDLAPGGYALLIGLYDPETGDRLPVSDAEGHSLGDSMFLERVEIER